MNNHIHERTISMRTVDVSCDLNWFEQKFLNFLSAVIHVLYHLCPFKKYLKLRRVLNLGVLLVARFARKENRIVMRKI